MKTFKQYITENRWGSHGGEETFVAQENGRRISKITIPPKDKFDLPMIIYRVFDKNGNIVVDKSTIITRPYFTNVEDATKAMRSNEVGVPREKL